MTPPRLTVAVQKASKLRPLPSAAEIRGWVGAAAAGADRRGGEVTVRIVDEEESAVLNERYRGKQGATNVLAFPAGADLAFPPNDTASAAGLDDMLLPLGDLVVCAPVIESEARQQGKISRAHWAHIVMHGTLHLLGYDHETGPAACVMEDRERALLAGFGFADPYSVESQ